MTAGGLIAGTSTAVNTIRRKGLDKVGVLVILEIVASIGLLFLTKDPRLLLIRPSFYTGIAAIYLMFTSLVGRPLASTELSPWLRSETRSGSLLTRWPGSVPRSFAAHTE